MTPGGRAWRSLRQDNPNYRMHKEYPKRVSAAEQARADRISSVSLSQFQEHQIMKRLAVVAIALAGICISIPAGAEEVGVGVGPLGVTVGSGHDRDRDRDREY